MGRGGKRWGRGGEEGRRGVKYCAVWGTKLTTQRAGNHMYVSAFVACVFRHGGSFFYWFVMEIMLALYLARET